MFKFERVLRILLAVQVSYEPQLPFPVAARLDRLASILEQSGRRLGSRLDPHEALRVVAFAEGKDILVCRRLHDAGLSSADSLKMHEGWEGL